MQRTSILNRIQRHKSFVYGKARILEEGSDLAIEVDIQPRSNGRPICSGCGKARPGYDSMSQPRRFRYVPLWGMAVYFVYTMRRVACPCCGVKVERVPWADGKSPLTNSFKWFLARWAKRLSWLDVARIFGTNWKQVYFSVKSVVSWGLAQRNLDDIESIGVDEIQWRRGHKYLTVIAKKVRQAIHVLDRFLMMQKMNKAIDKVRAAEAKRLEQDGYEPILKHSRWCLLKRKENLTEKQAVKLSELLQRNLRSVRSHLMREDFQRFWEYRYTACAAKFLDEWCTRTMRSKIEPMKKVAETLRRHRDLILNWFRADGMLSAGIVEGLNNKVKLAKLMI